MFDNKDRQLVFRYKKKFAKLKKEYGEEQARIFIENDIYNIVAERRYQDESQEQD